MGSTLSAGKQSTYVPAPARILSVEDCISKSEFLIDTGAVISILNRNYDYLPLRDIDYLNLYTANGQLLKVFGHNTISVDFGLGVKYTYTFLVADTNLNILGNDFLSHFDLSIRPALCEIRDLNTNKSVRLAPTNKNMIYSVIVRDDSINLQIKNLIKQYDHIFGPFSGVLKKEVMTKADIRTGTQQPVSCKVARNLSKQQEAIARKEFERMLTEGIVRRSQSQWASPLVLVPKKVKGDWRPCGDYRKLNLITSKDQYPLPNTEMILAECASKKYFSTLDAQRAFYQIPLTENAIPKTAVKTPFGLFEFVRMPYGLKNSAQTFQRYMDEVVHNIDNAHCYVDDIIIATNTIEEHYEALHKLFERLDKFGIRLNASKCIWCKESVRYLGHIISQNAVKPGCDKIDVIKRFPIPQTVKQLKSFLGTIEYYRRFFPKMSDLTANLQRHLKHESKRVRKSQAINLSIDDIDNINAIKTTFAEEMRLYSPDFSLPFQLYTDASDFAIGASLEQFRDGVRVPVAFYSKSLDKTERSYDTFGKELLAVYSAVRKFSHYLQPGNFTVFTDHQALLGAFKNSSDNHPRRVRTQLQKLTEYEFDIMHMKGKDNHVADYLSRLVTPITGVPTFVSVQDIQSEQNIDSSIKGFVSKAPHRFYSADIDGHRIWCVKQPNAEDNMRVIPVIPKNLRRRVFDSIHGMNHFGVKRTTNLVKKRYFWPGLCRDIKTWCNYCERCQISKSYRHTKVAQDPIEVPAIRFSEIHMDLVDLPELVSLQSQTASPAG